ncbi:hypothetical protein BCR44DRAFT_58581 [Catenaria anguillulae PL171]|uniref:UAS domain-containing protein n=1 Tax=Catenaria anguillulae PL171 TaxID=765915 RepID=A0A1Y2HEM6_9FUNG|nr:hypothetical protein BCR44DRAFT_58581 [Catenaria anguillulae PL171]
MSVLSKLLTVPYHVLASLYAVLATLLPFLPKLGRPRHTLLSGTDTQLGGATYDHAVARYDKLYTSQHPPFYRGSYRQLVDDVKQKLEFALVYLHSEDHDSTERFCKETLADAEFAALLAEHRINLYYGPMDHPEPYEVSSLLTATSYPFLALITLNSIHGVTKPTVVFRSEGYVPAATLVAKLRDAVQTHGLFVATIRQEREQREAERRMRAMQDEAYQASLARDRERQRQAEQEAERKRKAEEDKRQKRAALIQQLRDRKAKRAALRATYSPTTEPTSATPNRTLVQVACPTGRACAAHFVDSDPVRHLYEYVESLDPLGEDELNEEKWADDQVEREERRSARQAARASKAAKGADAATAAAAAAASSSSSSSEGEDGDDEQVAGGFKFVLVDVFPRKEHRDVAMSIAEAGLKGGNVVVEI